ncbi:hypothetical protein M0G74_09980 [Microbulbifer sp. CAU 1566]|uniref:hypothetical protein n=1 Tax=Microbulbifer sp. CAU 1566 TaxID=2933269 RepID=UPI00200669FA|nr:hypothetical protein [Microbulbifer sp. CAU 1566]MCK7597594.1 hypothetical protein [Microbulbifer sp. CAU 1566]
MNSNHWESSYRRAAGRIHSPKPLDEKVLSGLKGIKPIKPSAAPGNRLLSKVASGFSAVALAIVLLHPAQYIGAAPGQLTPQDKASGLDRYRPKPSLITPKTDAWHGLRTEVEAGNYIELCAQWRRVQRSSGSEQLPADLTAKARQHCRILP